MAKPFNFTKDIDALVKRVTPMLDEVNLETHVSQVWNQEEEPRKPVPEKIQKLGVLLELNKITFDEHRRLFSLELKSK